MMPANGQSTTASTQFDAIHGTVVQPQADVNDSHRVPLSPAGADGQPISKGVADNDTKHLRGESHSSVDGHGHNLRKRFVDSTHAGVKLKHRRAVTVLGRIGWCAKGIVYGLIGGLCCRGAISEGLQDTSPQGAFILLGKGSTGAYILIVMAAALATYIIWRFWEGITGQGSHDCYSRFKNFFTFRLSPFVSGAVYCAYLAYILYLIPKAFDWKDNKVENTTGSDFTKSWRNSNFGKFGLFLVGVAFLIAFIVMATQVLTKKFHRELRLKELRWWAKWLVLISGHVGAVGRAALFMGVAILMFRALGDRDASESRDQNTVSKALNQLVTGKGGRAVLFIIGFLLVIYNLFAVLNAYPAKIFPTPLPSPKEQQHMMEKRARWKHDRAHRKLTWADRFESLRLYMAEIFESPSMYADRHGTNSSHPLEHYSAAATRAGTKHSATVVPAEGKPVEAKPVENIPADAKSVEAKPVAALRWKPGNENYV